MNIIFIIIGIGAIVFSIFGFVLGITNKWREKEQKMKFTVPVIVLIAGFAAILISESFVIVPTGYTGVCTTFGQVSEEGMPKGFNLKIPFVQRINLVNNKQQDVTFSDQIWGETTEKTPVFATDVIVTFQVNSEKSAWLFINVSSDTKRLITDSLVASAIKSAMVELNVNDVTNRAKIEPLAKEKLIESLTEKYGAETISVLKVVINNMDFEDSYNDAIAAKSIAQQEKERQAIENQTAIAKAEADKSVAMAQAEAKAESAKIAATADAEVKKISAEAEANATKIKAEAEAEANKKVAESLTEILIEYSAVNNWDGQLPTYMSGDDLLSILKFAQEKPAQTEY